MHSLTRRVFIRVPLTCSMVPLFGASGRQQPLTLGAAIDKEIAASTSMASAFLGMQVIRLSDGAVLYERNQDHLFVPASNTKLFTTALALMRLGMNYRFVTSILASGPIDETGRLDGDLIFAGRGDPSMSARIYPFAKDTDAADPLRAIEDLADQVVAGGLKSVQGNVVGDDTRYPFAPYPGGWNMDDGVWEYGSPVSALIVNDNRLDVLITPGDEEGDLARVEVTPQFEFLTIDNRVRTVAARGEKKVWVDGRAGTPELQFWGTIPLGNSRDYESLAISDPAEFAASVLRDALIRRGVEVRGRAVARHRFLDEIADPLRGEKEPAIRGTELARRVSPPLIQLLQVVDKVSQNLHAEVLLREVGAVRRTMGTADAGLAELRTFLTGAGITDQQYRFMDGSGLSRGNMVSPEALTKLLAYMYATRYREQWLAMLPVGGVDGTLRKRFKGHPEAKDIHAKTGSLGHVRALSGYADSKSNGRLAFSLMLNNYAVTEAEASRFLDNIGLKLIP